MQVKVTVRAVSDCPFCVYSVRGMTGWLLNLCPICLCWTFADSWGNTVPVFKRSQRCWQDNAVWHGSGFRTETHPDSLPGSQHTCLQCQQWKTQQNVQGFSRWRWLPYKGQYLYMLCVNMIALLHINLLAPGFFFNFSTPVYKMWIIQEPNKLELWNELHFEEEKTESIYRV